jgi:hypothetical protein
VGWPSGGAVASPRQKWLEAVTLNGISSNSQMLGIKRRSFFPSTQIYPPVDGCAVGWPSGGAVASPGQQWLEAFTLNEMSSNSHILGIKRRSFFPSTQIYPPVDGCAVGWPPEGAMAPPRQTWLEAFTLNEMRSNSQI